MRVAITGASGFLGFAIASQMAAQGHVVAAIVRPGLSPRRHSVLADISRVITGSLGSIAALKDPLEDFCPDVVIHAAWSGVRGDERDRLSQMNNVVATCELAEIAAQVGAKVFIGLGSQAEYGILHEAATEATATNPVTLYGIAKLSACLASQRICKLKGMRWAWLRVFSVFGPRDNPACLIPSLIRQITAGESPCLTQGIQPWDFLYVDDAAKAIGAVALTAEANGIFNLGSGHAPQLRETIVTMRDFLDASVPLGFGTVPYSEGRVAHLQANIDRIMSLTRWRPETSLVDGLRATIAWHGQHKASEL